MQVKYTKGQASLAAAFLTEEATVDETTKAIEVKHAFNSYKRDTDAETERPKLDLETDQTDTSTQISGTELRDLSTRVSHQADHNKARERAHRELKRRCLTEEAVKNSVICKIESAREFVECTRRLVNDFEDQVPSLVEYAATEKQNAVGCANYSSEMARDQLVRRVQAEKKEMKGHIETLVWKRDRRQLHVSSVVGEIELKP